MKNFKHIFIIVVAIVLFASCSDDEPLEGVKESGLVGTWVWSDYDGGDAYLELIATFKSNSTGTFVSNMNWKNGSETNTYKFTWSVDGDMLYNEMEYKKRYGDIFQSSPALYKIIGDKLHITAIYVNGHVDFTQNTTVFTKM